MHRSPQARALLCKNPVPTAECRKWTRYSGKPRRCLPLQKFRRVDDPIQSTSRSTNHASTQDGLRLTSRSRYDTTTGSVQAGVFRKPQKRRAAPIRLLVREVASVASDNAIELGTWQSHGGGLTRLNHEVALRSSVANDPRSPTHRRSSSHSTTAFSPDTNFMMCFTKVTCDITLAHSRCSFLSSWTEMTRSTLHQSLRARVQRLMTISPATRDGLHQVLESHRASSMQPKVVVHDQEAAAAESNQIFAGSRYKWQSQTLQLSQSSGFIDECSSDAPTHICDRMPTAC